MKRKSYDEDLLVHLLARGDMTHKAIGARVGLGRGMVSMISCGTRRGDLQPRIRAANDEFRKRAHRLGARSLVSLVAKHIKEGLDDDTDPELARKCREYAMDKFLDAPESTTTGHQPLPTPGLTSEDYEAIAKLKGGPSDDEPAR